ncbi:atypical/ABC1/ABC1-C protein kinase [Coprinopsis cinerea AmutBmut pab1-1]|nr:atypical/ABC1/ABC1-C protein kinase [Coprinopsis cinerea AmutBmut pab1-1]
MLRAARIPRLVRSPRFLWLAAPLVVGGGVLVITRQPQTLQHSDILSSPALIPRRAALNPTILSPSEDNLTLKSSILELLREHVWEPIRTAVRFLRLFALFFPVILSSPMLLVGRPMKEYKGDRWGAVWWYGYLVQQMEAAGPTFIKLAQWAASRVDLFPPILCERLGALHSQGTPHPFSHTKKVVEAVFQRPFDQVFEEFDQTPIGSGAIAQVYRATLKRDLIPPSYHGPRRTRQVGGALGPIILEDPPPSAPTASVAIKILHPRVEKTISRDLAIMHFFASCISLLPGMKWLSLPEEVLVFGEMMNQQLDLRHEADNLITFEANFAPRKVPVTFPRPLKIWSSKDILVEEYQNALPLETFLRNGGGPYDYQIATVGLNAFLTMLLLDNFVHSDLHPGNIMIKFSKPPTTRILLQNLYNHFFPSSVDQSTSDVSSASLMIPADYSQSDEIVARLRKVSNSPDEWSRELLKLHSGGYVPEIVFIDAGLVTTLNDTNRTNFLDLFKAVAEFDGYKTGQLMIERSRTPELAVDKETFALKMQHLILSIKRKTFSLGQIKIADLLTDVLKNVRKHRVKMEPDFINTVISILLLEGIGRQLDPKMDLFASALPILRQLGGQMAMDTKVEGLPSAKDLPTSDLAALLKVWVWIEARSFISGALVDMDALIQRDWLTPNI